VETTNWQNRFEYRAFGYVSIWLELSIYAKKNPLHYSETYYLDISISNEEGVPVLPYDELFDAISPLINEYHVLVEVGFTNNHKRIVLIPMVD
jgi:hypothetical protein